jgi:hypothetical protein
MHAVAQHGLLDRWNRWITVLGVRGSGGRSGDHRNINPQDLRQAGQRPVAVDAAFAPFHLGKP